MKRILYSLLIAALPFGSVLGSAEIEGRKGDPRLPARVAERSRKEHQRRSRRIWPGRLLGWSHPREIRLHLRDRA
jgi:hypothetical protein